MDRVTRCGRQYGIGKFVTKLPKIVPTDQKSTNETISSMLRNICVTRPSANLSIGKKGNSSETIDKIIKSAREVFTEDGHAGLSLRKVAENAGIAVGNLTYHFPTKRSLLMALIEEARADYAQKCLKIFESPEISPLDTIFNMLELYIADARTTHRFFLQMWSYAASDKEANDTVKNWYRDYSRMVYYLVRDANPALTHEQRLNAMMQFSSLIEAFRVFLTIGVGEDPALANAEKRYRDLVVRILFHDHTSN